MVQIKKKKTLVNNFPKLKNQDNWHVDPKKALFFFLYIEYKD